MKLARYLGITWLIAVLQCTSALAPYGLEEPMAIQVKQTRNEHLSEPINQKTSSHNRSITIVGDQFMLDGQPLRIVSGSLHYFRLPAAYWQDRLRKLKAAGLNSVTTYVEWSYHEPQEGQYIFTGDRDVVKFIQIAQEEGLHVVLRPGPYICAERDLGGFPSWLLGKFPNIRLRTTDKNFMDESKIWLHKLFNELSPMLYGNGGPIILVQVENEYGSYAGDMAYKVQLRDTMKELVGTNALLFTTDGTSPSMIRNGMIPDTLTTIDFGIGSGTAKYFQGLRQIVPRGPLMNSEFYPGWLTHWGEPFQRVDAHSVVKTLGDILDYGASVNFYMFFGGSNFEYTAGANYGGTYQPDITSYDYDAPLTEAGDPTPKYYMIRDKLKSYNLVDESLELPQPSSKGAYGLVNVSCKADLLSDSGRSSLGKRYPDVNEPPLPTFEHLRQRSGLMLYETTVDKEAHSLVEITRPRDLIYVFVDGVYQGRISRMLKIYSVPVITKVGSKISLLVENQGRINYGNRIHDFKGILSSVIFDSKELNGKWLITGYPLETFSTTNIINQTCEPFHPSMFEGTFILNSQDNDVKDTYIDTTGWGKGYIWINGYNLGRYWPGIGPQVTLYVPGVWLKPAPEENVLQILELQKPSTNLTMEFIDHAILDRK